MRDRMKVFVSFEEVEGNISAIVQQNIYDIILEKAPNVDRKPEDVIFDYLSHGKWEKRLKIIVGLSGGSLEKLKRILDSLRPNNSFAEIPNNVEMRQLIAHFLAQPEEYSNQIPEFIIKCFYLRPGWIGVLQDKRQVEAIVRNALQSKYAVHIGLALEKNIIEVVKGLGLKFMKGPIEIVDNKEVDVVIPDTKNPLVLIMSSYALTTASSQSSRANEQELMYQNIQTHNRRRRQKVKLLNVIDGGGWLARSNDLKKMMDSCDKCFCNADLLDGTLKNYLENLFD